jgi:hypothetical protein
MAMSEMNAITLKKSRRENIFIAFTGFQNLSGLAGKKTLANRFVHPRKSAASALSAFHNYRDVLRGG